MKTFAASVVLAGVFCQSVESFGSVLKTLDVQVPRPGSWGPENSSGTARARLVKGHNTDGEQIQLEEEGSPSSPVEGEQDETSGVELSGSANTLSEQTDIEAGKNKNERNEVVEQESDTLIEEQVFGEGIRFKAVELQASQRASLEKALGKAGADSLIADIKSQSEEKQWKEMLSMVRSIFLGPLGDIDEDAWKVFDLIKIVAGLRLFNNKHKNSLNPCYLFCTSSLLGEYLYYPEAKAGDPDKVLQTAGVYLYALGSFLSGEKEPGQYGPGYQNAIKSLGSLERAGQKVQNPIEWAITSAKADRGTQDYVKRCNPKPSF